MNLPHPSNVVDGLGLPLPKLSTIVSYECDTAVRLFRRYYVLDHEAAKDVFSDVLRWLWLGQFHARDLDRRKPAALDIFPAMRVVDEMWHSFVLCTPDYSEFCTSHFGAYIHHVPEAPLTVSGDGGSTLPGCIDYTIRVLGRSTAFRWFCEYPLTFDRGWFNTHRASFNR